MNDKLVLSHIDPIRETQTMKQYYITYTLGLAMINDALVTGFGFLLAVAGHLSFPPSVNSQCQSPT